MLTHIGFHKTLLIYSFVQGALLIAGFLLVKTRFPDSQFKPGKRNIQWVDNQYLKDKVFWSFWTALLFAVLWVDLRNARTVLISCYSGYLSPFVYISVYTSEKLPHISPQLANLPISIMSFASAIGRTTVGISADRIGFINAFILVLLFSSFSQAVLWNVAAESYAGIMAFS
jgi:hypothetical protein